MLKYVLDYEVKPGDNLPGGLPRQSLVVLSPVWRGPALTIEYPDGDTETLLGRTPRANPARCGSSGPGRIPGGPRSAWPSAATPVLWPSCMTE